MNDFDFEELDRAVSSLATQDTPVQSPTPIASAPVAGAPQPAPAPVTPVQPSTVPQAPAAPVAAPVAPTPVAPRPRAGRFMDVVHPSSDMRTTTPVAPRADTPAPLVAPTSSIPEMPADTMTEAAPSPFLPDAKVEKRPLGGVPGVDTEQISPASVVAPIEPAPSPTLTEPMPELAPVAVPAAAAPVPEAPAMPSADSAQTVANTSEETPVETEADAAPSAPLSRDEQEKLMDTPLPPELNEDVLSAEASDDTTPPVAPVDATAQFGALQGSIPPQYADKTDAPVDAGQTAPVYDAHAFTQPAKKKGHGWLIVLWIALLIVLGVGAGYALYTYILPTL